MRHDREHKASKHRAKTLRTEFGIESAETAMTKLEVRLRNHRTLGKYRVKKSSGLRKVWTVVKGEGEGGRREDLQGRIIKMAEKSTLEHVGKGG